MANGIVLNNREIWRVIDEIAPEGILDTRTPHHQNSSTAIHQLTKEEIEQLGPSFTRANLPVVAIRDNSGRVLFCICKTTKENKSTTDPTFQDQGKREYFIEELMVYHTHARLQRALGTEHYVPGLTAILPDGRHAFLSVVAGHPVSTIEDHSIGWDVFKKKPHVWAANVAYSVVFRNPDMTGDNTLVYADNHPAVADTEFIAQVHRDECHPTLESIELLRLPKGARRKPYFEALRHEVLRLCDAFDENPNVAEDALTTFIATVADGDRRTFLAQEKQSIVRGVHTATDESRRFFEPLGSAAYKPTFVGRNQSSIRRRLKRTDEFEF